METQQEPFTYDALRRLAVAPSEHGAYGGQAFDGHVGLHVHRDQPDEIHVIYDDWKIAEVTPRGTRILMANSQLTPAMEAFRNRLPGSFIPAW